jgi:hypothetical protein
VPRRAAATEVRKGSCPCEYGHEPQRENTAALPRRTRVNDPRVTGSDRAYLPHAVLNVV